MLTASGCDAGKATFDEAVDLEEKGEHVAAAEKYDAVCRRAPDSKMCPPSVQRAAALRLRAAEAAMKSKNYAEAEKLARAVDEGQDEPSKRRAAELLVSEEMQTGLRWAKASAATDKRAVLKEVADLAKGDAPVAGDAKAWLTKELPPLLLEDAKAACGPSGGSECRKAW